MMSEMPQYVYHHEKKKLFFGKFMNSTKDVEFEWTPPNKTASISTSTSTPLSITLNGSNLILNTSLEFNHTVTETGNRNDTEKQILLVASSGTVEVPLPSLVVISSVASTVAARDVDLQLESPLSNVTDSPSELAEKDSLFEKLRIKGSTVSTWWWEQMEKKEG